MIGEHRGRRFDWHPRLMAESLRYELAPKDSPLPTSGRLWRTGRVLDQGREGACVGFGSAGEAAAEPVPVPGVTDAYARGWYQSAKRRDQWPGEAYDGTSVLAGCLEGRARGLYGAFGWGRSAEALATGIVGAGEADAGPAIIGVEWRSGSYETDGLGILQVTGSVVGGHCLCVPGFLPNATDLDDQLAQDLAELDLLDGLQDLSGPAFVILNSWGPVFGKRGLALVPLADMRTWIRAGAELAVPQGRSLPPRRAAGRRSAEAGGDATLHVDVADVQPGDRVLDPPEELGQESATVTGPPRVLSGHGGRRAVVPTTAGSFTLAVGSPVTVRRPS